MRGKLHALEARLTPPLRYTPQAQLTLQPPRLIRAIRAIRAILKPNIPLFGRALPAPATRPTKKKPTVIAIAIPITTRSLPLRLALSLRLFKTFRTLSTPRLKAISLLLFGVTAVIYKVESTRGIRSFTIDTVTYSYLKALI